MNRSLKRFALGVGLALFLSCSDTSDEPTSPGTNQPPRINGVSVTPGTLTVGDQARIRVDATDPDQDQLTASYVSQLGIVAAEANSMNAVYSAARAGRDLLVVRVTDARGAEAHFETYLTVNASTTPGVGEGPPPRLSFSPPPASNGTIVVGQGDDLRVNLCGEPASGYRISWGDGTPDAATCSATHAYTSSGTFRLVSDISGAALVAARTAARTATRDDVRAAQDVHDERWVSVIPPGGPGPRPLPSGSPTTTVPGSTTTTSTLPSGSTTTTTTTPGGTTTTSTLVGGTTTTTTLPGGTTTTTLPGGTTTTTSTLAPTTTITTTTTTTSTSTTTTTSTVTTTTIVF